jgi:hypothetical protein
VVVQRGEHQSRTRPCLFSYPLQVCAHRLFTPCIVSMFLLQWSSDRRGLHSTGISRFTAKPAPIPRDEFIRLVSFYVDSPYPGSYASGKPSSRLVAPTSLSGSMLSETPECRSMLVYNVFSAWPAYCWK